LVSDENELAGGPTIIGYTSSSVQQMLDSGKLSHWQLKSKLTRTVVVSTKDEPNFLLQNLMLIHAHFTFLSEKLT
jgi:hypothetical protein